MNMNSLLARMGNMMPDEDHLPMSLLNGGSWNPHGRWGSMPGFQNIDPRFAAAAERTNHCAAVEAADSADAANSLWHNRSRPYRKCRSCCCCCCCCCCCHCPRPCPPVSDRVPFTLHKVNQNGTSLGGAIFQMEQYQGCDVLTQTVNAMGSATFEVLPDTYYILREIEAPAGYTPMTETPYIFVTAEGLVYVDGVLTERPTFTDTPVSAVFRFSKLSSTGQPLSGAMFTLTIPSDGMRTANSDANGLVTFNNLAPGAYTMRETIPPAGYAPNTTVYQVVVSTNGTVTVDGRPASTFFVLNVPM